MAIKTRHLLNTPEKKLVQIYYSQVSNSKRRGHNPPAYNRTEFVEFGINSNGFLSLYREWVKSGYNRQKAPTFDRIDDSMGYSFSNFNEWMTAESNRRKLHAQIMNCERVSTTKPQKKIMVTDIKNNNDMYFDSMGEASRELGIDRSSICKCCKGKIKRVGLYTCKYL